MGMFDSVFVTCPHCKYPNELQSKAGSCILQAFSIKDMPAAIAQDLLGDYYCDHCDKQFTIERIVVPKYRVIPTPRKYE